MVGLGGNNATTLIAGILANKFGYTWETNLGVKSPNWFGSITQSSTIRVGMDASGKDVYVPLKCLVPMVNPNDIEIDGWDISSLDLGQAMKRSQVRVINYLFYFDTDTSYGWGRWGSFREII